MKHSLAFVLALGAAGSALAQATPPGVATLEAPIIGSQGTTIGSVSLWGGQHATVMRVQVQPGALTPGWHAIHFHAVGDCSDTAKFEASKAHVNHSKKKHGLLNPEGPDEGDLPNVFANQDGAVNAEVSTTTLLDGKQGLRDADGSALVVHASPDDYHTQPIGGAGARVGCAVIKK